MMNAWWGLALLLGCRLLRTSQSTCNDKLDIVHVPVGGHVSVPCPNTSAEEVKYKLFKNSEYIYQHTRIHGQNTSNHNLSTDKVGVEYDIASSFSFTLMGVNASSQGIYRCEGTVMFHPPLIELPSDFGILLLIKEPQRNNMNEIETTPDNQTSQSGLMWIFALVLGCYSVAVTIGVIIFWVKWRKDDSQSDYINTNSKTTRGNKRRLDIPKLHYLYAPN